MRVRWPPHRRWTRQQRGDQERRADEEERGVAEEGDRGGLLRRLDDQGAGKDRRPHEDGQRH
eukprot:15770540-Heterocapsa_arctica.AAC.1